MNKIANNLLVYGFGHALVDLMSAVIVFSLLFISPVKFFGYTILYGILAFGLQAPLGLIVDRFKLVKHFAITGLLVCLIGIFLVKDFQLIAILFAGVGNALFHLGGGIVSLSLKPGKASFPGLYVAPGAIGLFIGTLIGKSGNLFSILFLIITLLVCLFILIVKIPDYPKKNKSPKYFELILFLLLISIFIRAFIGVSLVFEWKSNLLLVVFLVFCVFAGKSFGGILADKFGWIKIGGLSLLLSIPLLCYYNIWYLASLGLFLFNMTMPITLVAIHNLMREWPGFSFGLTTFALILGSIPAFFGFKIFSWTVIAFMIALSALFLYLALKLQRVQR